MRSKERDVAAVPSRAGRDDDDDREDRAWSELQKTIDDVSSRNCVDAETDVRLSRAFVEAVLGAKRTLREALSSDDESRMTKALDHSVEWLQKVVGKNTDWLCSKLLKSVTAKRDGLKDAADPMRKLSKAEAKVLLEKAMDDFADDFAIKDDEDYAAAKRADA